MTKKKKKLHEPELAEKGKKPVATAVENPIPAEPATDIKQVQESFSETHCTRFSAFDIHLFREGKHYKLYDKLGAHQMTWNGQEGTYFALWAPNAEAVSVIGDFNHWRPYECNLQARHDYSGIWE